MSIEVTRDNLVSTFLGEWAETPVYESNHRESPTDDSYIIIQIGSTLSEQPCLGREDAATWERDFGDIILSVRVPVGGSVDGLAMSERARRILSQKTINGSVTQVGYTVSIGITPDDRHYGYVVRIPFRTDNLKT